ncbi:hypothetical protein L873DRAFT_1786236 [Choiromyces venosus 120613-1]|uniref:Uncharacterized protein n=1 Tax=Choiromyces venosus 120613-1 TaxID=1336337 RepID=A0A3N4K1I4_9PEZI|nr:hypothetical protein L873DRAFT_1786236 [Choiromyces venosus 120613-1]
MTIQYPPSLSPPILSYPLPATSLHPLSDADRDTGTSVAGILLNRARLLGKEVYGATDYYTPVQITHAFPPQGQYVLVEDEVFRSFLLEGIAAEILETFKYMAEFGYFEGGKAGVKRAGEEVAVGRPRGCGGVCEGGGGEEGGGGRGEVDWLIDRLVGFAVGREMVG